MQMLSAAVFLAAAVILLRDWARDVDSGIFGLITGLTLAAIGSYYLLGHPGIVIVSVPLIIFVTAYFGYHAHTTLLRHRVADGPRRCAHASCPRFEIVTTRSMCSACGDETTPCSPR